MGINDQIINLIKERLDKGWVEYNREVPIRRERGLSNIEEAVDEVLDLVVYLTAYILEMKADREDKKPATMSVSDMSLILRGLHRLHSAAWEENQQNEANEIHDLIERLKKGSKWNHEDDKRIGQTDNPINKEMQIKEATGPTKCIPGSNCD